MARLTAHERRALPAADFAGGKKKGSTGSYPDNDLSHARDAIRMVDAYGSPAKKAEVKARVHRDWPSISIQGLKKASSHLK